MTIKPIDTTTVVEPQPKTETPPSAPHGSEASLPKHLPTGPGPAKLPPTPKKDPHGGIVT